MKCAVLIQKPIPNQSDRPTRFSRRQHSVRHSRSRRLPRERLKVGYTMTMHELNRLNGEARGELIRYGAGVDCADKGEVSNGIL